MVLWLYSKHNEVWKKLEVEFIRLMFVTRQVTMTKRDISLRINHLQGRLSLLRTCHEP